MISTSFADDLERTVAVGARLVSSRPPSSADGGLLVSEPVHLGFGKPALDADVALGGWGRVTALGTFGADRDQLVAVGGEGRATLVALDEGRFGRRRFEVDLPSGPPPSPGTAGCCGLSAASSPRLRSTTTGGRTGREAATPALIPRTAS